MKIRNAINESNHELYDIIAYLFNWQEWVFSKC